MYIYLIEEVKEAFTNDWTLKNLFSSATTVFPYQRGIWYSGPTGENCLSTYI